MKFDVYDAMVIAALLSGMFIGFAYGYGLGTGMWSP